MKTVKFDLAVNDIYRLHEVLRAADPPYAVLGVGVDGRCTYINLDDSEQRDPTDLVRGLCPQSGLRLGSRNRHGIDGIPVALADGKERIEIDIYKVDPTTGFVSSVSERVQIKVSGGVSLPQDTVEITNGMGLISVGPTDQEGECEVTAEDASGARASMRTRFIRPENNNANPNPSPWLKILSG
jgi:hypothetical protein